ncbi:hypothetical protein SXCC_03319 [Gluconacetobacter sp. SXCC-1]|nr:hypothetical protein SXCC_03319 [Gluconacetobacter sp. SXCC-1]
MAHPARFRAASAMIKSVPFCCIAIPPDMPARQPARTTACNPYLMPCHMAWPSRPPCLP